MYLSLKNTLFSFIFIFSLFSLQSSFAADEEDTQFVITAYYSPLPGQNSYLQGNYEDEIKMNGKGTHGSSGKQVFPGMLAGPSNYPFGTKIYLEGYGVGEIADRGGAISNSGSSKKCVFDCLDIWMGYGDAGLSRAKAWGIQTVKSKLINSDAKVSLEFGQAGVPGIFGLEVGPESSSGEVLKLQKLFTELDLYTGELDSIYESISDELLQFQIQNKVVKDSEDWGAGYFGKKTANILQKKYGKTIPLVSESLTNFADAVSITMSNEHTYILEYGNLEINPESASGSILKLQELLSKLGEYNGEIDGNFESLKTPLIHLQIQLGIISNAQDPYAGYFGPKTKTALWEYYSTQKKSPPQAQNTQSIEDTEKEIKVDNIKPIKQALGLSQNERQVLDAIITSLQEKLRKSAIVKGKIPQEVISRFSQELKNYLPQIQKEKLRLKMTYIVENM